MTKCLAFRGAEVACLLLAIHAVLADSYIITLALFIGAVIAAWKGVSA